MADPIYTTETRSDANGNAYQVRLPQTAPAPVVTPPPIGTPTIGEAYKIPGANVGIDPNVAATEKLRSDFLDNEIGTGTVDENAIRTNTANKFQAQIDAINNIYADKILEAKQTGTSRLKSNDAVQNRRGLLGSDFGAAQTADIEDANQADVDALNEQKGAKISAILTESKNSADAEIEKKRAAIASGLDARLAYYKDAATRKTAGATSAAQFIYNQKLSPADLSPDQLAVTAKNYGITPQDITAAYIDVKKAGDLAATKATQDAAKAKKEAQTVLAQGTQVVDENGKLVATGPEKTFAPKTTKAPTGTTKNYSAANIPNDVSKDLQYDLKTQTTKTLQDFIDTYPDVSTSYLKTLFSTYRPTSASSKKSS